MSSHSPIADKEPVAERRPRRHWWRFCAVCGGVLAALLMVAYLLFTGPRDLARYPARSTSPYRLPWPAGKTVLCSQSNRGIVSHRGWEEYAYDFSMPVGSDVCAARAGTVQRVVIEHDGHGLHMPNNLISIDHGDGTLGWYLHLQKGGSLVRVGDQVRQGQAIAHSGDVGRSLAPHLHFQVTDADRSGTMPVAFQDAGTGRGVPRMFFFYTSGNSAPAPRAGKTDPF